MTNEIISPESLVIVKQLPVIEEQLKTVKAKVEERTTAALALVCTEDTLSSVKKERTAINKEFEDFEARRKAVKKLIISPYEQFETTYKDCVSDSYKAASTALTAKINAVEDTLKEERSKELRLYFNELCRADAIDFVSFEQTHINVTLSASMKSLKELVLKFFERISEDLQLIDTQEHKSEILYEYKGSLNVSSAITTVSNRYKALEAEKARAEEAAKKAAEREAAAAKVDETIEELTAPTVMDEPQTEEKIFEVTFTVHGTREKISALKAYLIKEEYING